LPRTPDAGARYTTMMTMSPAGAVVVRREVEARADIDRAFCQVAALTVNQTPVALN
jgi:hypothetical protein